MFFFFNDTATTEIYTLSLHDALPIFPAHQRPCRPKNKWRLAIAPCGVSAENVSHAQAHNYRPLDRDRKSTRLNSSHLVISYAVFCLKKKTQANSEVTYGWNQTQLDYS